MRISKTSFFLLLSLLLWSQVRGHYQCIWCRPARSPQQINTDIYRMSDLVAARGRSTMSGTRITVFGSCQLTQSDPLTLCVLSYNRQAELHNYGNNVMMLPLAGATFEGVNDVTEAHGSAQSQIVVLNTDSTTEHYFAYVPIESAQIDYVQMYTLPKEAGFDYVMVESRRYYADRFYFLFQNGVDTVHIYKILNLEDVSEMKFQERLEITFPDASMIDMRVRGAQRSTFGGSLPNEDKLVVAGYHRDQAYHQEVIWLHLTDPSYVLQDLPTLDWAKSQDWDMGQSFNPGPKKFRFVERRIESQNIEQLWWNHYEFQWVTDGQENQLEQLILRCIKFGNYGCNNVNENNVVFRHHKISCSINSAHNKIVDWHWMDAFGQINKTNSQGIKFPDYHQGRYWMLRSNSDGSSYYLQIQQWREQLGNANHGWAWTNVAREINTYSPSASIEFVPIGEHHAYLFGRGFSFSDTIPDSDWLAEMPSASQTYHSDEGPLFEFDMTAGYCHWIFAAFSGINGMDHYQKKQQIDTVTDFAVSKRPSFVVQSGSSLPSNAPSGFVVSPQYEPVVRHRFDCLPEFENRDYHTDRKVMTIELHNDYRDQSAYFVRCKETKSIAWSEPRWPSLTNEVHWEGTQCKWQVNKIPALGDRGPDYQMVIQETQLAFPEVHTLHPEIRVDVKVCSNDKIRNADGSIFTVRTDALRSYYNTMVDVFPRGILCPSEEFKMSLPYVNETYSRDNDTKKLIQPYWAPDGVGLEDGIIHFNSPMPNSTSYVWINGTNEGFKLLGYWLTQKVEFVFIDCYHYEGHQITPTVASPIQFDYYLGSDRISYMVEDFTYEQECTEHPLYYQWINVDTGKENEKSSTGIFTNNAPSVLELAVYTDKERFEGTVILNCTANMILRDGGISQGWLTFEVTIRTGDPASQDVSSLSGNTAPYFENAYPTSINIGIGQSVTLFLSNWGPSDADGDEISVDCQSGSASTFVSWNENTLVMIIDPDSIAFQDTTHTITCSLEDDDVVNPMATQYQIPLTIQPEDYDGYLIQFSDGSEEDTRSNPDRDSGSGGSSGSGQGGSGLSAVGGSESSGSGSGASTTPGNSGNSQNRGSNAVAGGAQAIGNSILSGLMGSKYFNIGGSGSDWGAGQLGFAGSAGSSNPFINQLGDDEYLQVEDGAELPNKNEIMQQTIPPAVRNRFPKYKKKVTLDGDSVTSDDEGDSDSVGYNSDGFDDSESSLNSDSESQEDGSSSDSQALSEDSLSQGGSLDAGSKNSQDPVSEGLQEDSDGSRSDIDYLDDLDYENSYTAGSNNQAQSSGVPNQVDSISNSEELSSEAYSPWLDRKFLNRWSQIDQIDEINDRLDPLEIETISFVDQEGSLGIYFNNELLVPSIFDDKGYPRKIKKKVMREVVKSDYQESSDDYRRQLQDFVEEEIEVDGPTIEITQFLQFMIFPGDWDAAIGRELAFNVTLKRFQSQMLTVHLNFTNPQAISKSGSKLDKLQVKVIDQSLFVSAKTGLPISDDEKETTFVLPQMAWESSVATKAVVASLEGGINVLLIMNVFLACCVGSALKRMWAFLNAMQIIVYMHLFCGVFPSNAAIVYDFLDSAVNARYLGDILNAVMGYSRETDVYAGDIDQKIQLKIGGLESVTLIANAGGYFAIFVLLCLLVTVFVLISCLAHKSSQLKLLRDKMRSYMTPNILFRFMFQSALKLFNVSISFFTITSVTYSWYRPVILGTSLFLYAFVLPLFTTVVVYTLYYREELNDPVLKGRFGQLWTSLRRSCWSLSYNIVFIFRRLWLVLLLTQLKHLNWLQLQLLVMSHVAYLIYLGSVEAFKLKEDQRLELFNEFMVLICSYHLLCFTSWLDSPSARYSMGWSLVAIIAITTAVNLTLIVVPAYHKVVRWRAVYKQSRSSFDLKHKLRDLFGIFKRGKKYEDPKAQKPSKSRRQRKKSKRLTNQQTGLILLQQSVIKEESAEHSQNIADGPAQPLSNQVVVEDFDLAQEEIKEEQQPKISTNLLSQKSAVGNKSLRLVQEGIRKRLNQEGLNQPSFSGSSKNNPKNAKFSDNDLLSLPNLDVLSEASLTSRHSEASYRSKLAETQLSNFNTGVNESRIGASGSVQKRGIKEMILRHQSKSNLSRMIKPKAQSLNIKGGVQIGDTVGKISNHQLRSNLGGSLRVETPILFQGSPKKKVGVKQNILNHQLSSQVTGLLRSHTPNADRVDHSQNDDVKQRILKQQQSSNAIALLNSNSFRPNRQSHRGRHSNESPSNKSSGSGSFDSPIGRLQGRSLNRQGNHSQFRQSNNLSKLSEVSETPVGTPKRQESRDDFHVDGFSSFVQSVSPRQVQSTLARKVGHSLVSNRLKTHSIGQGLMQTKFSMKQAQALAKNHQ